MKKVHNEQGYTLLLTMVLITVVVLLFATFTMKALSQQKQVEQTDDTFEVTAIAEMGIEYYHTEVLNLITETLFSLKNDNRYKDTLVDDQLTASEKTNRINSLELEYRTKLQKQLECIDNDKDFENSICPHSDKSINLIKTVNEINSSPSVNFSLLDSKILTSSGHPQLEIEVEGNISNKQNKISTILNLPANLLNATFIPGATITSGTHGGTITAEDDLVISNKTTISNQIKLYNRVTITTTNRSEIYNSNIYIKKLEFTNNKESNGNKDILKLNGNSKVCIKEISGFDAKKINTTGGSNVYILTVKTPTVIENAIRFVLAEEFNSKCNFINTIEEDSYVIHETVVVDDITEEVIYH